MSDPGLRIADRWPALYNWIRGGSVQAHEVGRDCRDVLAYLGVASPADEEQPEEPKTDAELTWADMDRARQEGFEEGLAHREQPAGLREALEEIRYRAETFGGLPVCVEIRDIAEEALVASSPSGENA